jgi:hypothetical protein
MSALALARHPGLLAPVAILLALIAARMTERHHTLAAVAVATSTLAFIGGMTVAIVTAAPLF